MEIKNTEDCFKFRLLRKIKPDLTKSGKSMEITEARINSAINLLKFRIYRYVILESYMAMFHAARALLYKDGIQEKSHYAVSIYLKEKYANQIPLPILNYLQIHRVERHEAMYGLEYDPDENEAITALNDSKAFVGEVRKIFFGIKNR